MTYQFVSKDTRGLEMEHMPCGYFKFSIMGLFNLKAMMHELRLKTTIAETITQMVRALISLSFARGHMT